ncbi:TRAP transporter small permease [Castellaniella daejeonensis]|jgi:TRAP-type C4-dicarboxylate transport system permease small subunit|uniref:TRAP transporter small permease protein n=1 Tax=Castellaniella daejeonensis TaxID=659013 RepID=A0ABN0TIK7_9BURK|nr:TRAP transporter small permease subunit [Castellaniella sp.]HET8703961.1 TRAP transporter small permease subunit [Castellaniella sp.]
MRRFLDGLYTASGWLAGLCMIGVLLMVTLMILGRLLGFPIGGADAYAGYAMAGAGFLALASTLKHGEHIRVTLVLSMLHGKGRRALEIIALLIAVALSGFLALYSVRLVWQSWSFQDISTGIDATPMWIPQIPMAVGTLIFFIAFLDEFVLELSGKRPAAATEELHHE